MTICDRIAVLDQGVIQQIGTPFDLYDRPVNRFVAQFVGSVNLFAGTVTRDSSGARFRSPELGDVPLPPSLRIPESGAVEIAFRPHAVAFGSAGPDAFALDGVIEGGEFLGEFMRYEVRVGSAVVVADRAHLWGGEVLEKGARVRLSVAPREIRLV